MSYLQDYERHAYVGFVQRVIEKKICDHVKNVYGLKNAEIDVCYCESFSTRCMVYRAHVKGSSACIRGTSVDECYSLSVVMTCSGFTTIVEVPWSDEEEEEDEY